MGGGITDPLASVPTIAAGDKAAQQVQQVANQYAQTEGLVAQIYGLAKPKPEEILQLQQSAEYGGSAITYLNFITGNTPPTDYERTAYQAYLNTSGSNQSIEEWTVSTRMQNAFPSLSPEKQVKMKAAIEKVMARAKDFEEKSEEQQIKKGSQLGLTLGASRGGLIGSAIGLPLGMGLAAAGMFIPGVNVVVAGVILAAAGGAIFAGAGSLIERHNAIKQAKIGNEYLESSFLSQGLTSALKDLSTDPEFGEEVRMLQTQMVVFAYDHQIKIAKPEEKEEKAKTGVTWLISQEANRLSSKYGSLPAKILEFLAKQTVEDAAEWVANNVKDLPGLGNKASGYTAEFLQDIRIMQASARLKKLANDPSVPTEFYTELWNEYTTTGNMGPMLDKLENQDMATSKGIGNKIGTWFESIIMAINNAISGVSSQFSFNKEYKAPSTPNLSVQNTGTTTSMAYSAPTVAAVPHIPTSVTTAFSGNNVTATNVTSTDVAPTAPARGAPLAVPQPAHS